MNAMMIVLRLIHILSGIFWVGSAAMAAFFLFPALKGAGRSAVPVMAGLAQRGLMKAIPASAGLTIFSGAAMLWIVSGGQMSAYSATRVGRGFTTAAGIAIITFIVGIIWVKPANDKAGALAKEVMTATDADKPAKQEAAAAQQAKAAKLSMMVTWGLILAAAGMAVSRYL